IAMRSVLVAFGLLFALATGAHAQDISRIEVTEFGIYAVDVSTQGSNSAGNEVELTKITTFPPPGLRPPGASGPVTKTERTLRNKVGETRFTSYVLSNDYEVVPGVWTIELWAGGRRLASES